MVADWLYLRPYHRKSVVLKPYVLDNVVVVGWSIPILCLCTTRDWIFFRVGAVLLFVLCLYRPHKLIIFEIAQLFKIMQLRGIL